MSKQTRGRAAQLTHEQIVVLATYLAGGDTKYADTEDIAMATTKVAPGRFSWVKYKDQVNIENVRRRLLDATLPQNGGHLTGSQKKGWLLTEAGLAFCRENAERLRADPQRQQRLSRAEQSWVARERVRMTQEPAFKKWEAGQTSKVSAVEAERFFRIDDYMNPTERRACISRASDAFRADERLSAAVEAISVLVRNA